jgi:Fur family ferric uptake transcriptional regulator/Fur family peroxide stress response transcriptional regulator
MTNYAKLLKDHELKATFQRMTILSTIEKMGHTDVDEIYEQVIKAHPTLSLATVYKNIITMVEKDVLVEVPIRGRKSKFEISKDEHIHLICTQCGKVMDKELTGGIDADAKKIAGTNGFVLENSQINLYGVCSSCQGQKG